MDKSAPSVKTVSGCDAFPITEEQDYKLSRIPTSPKESPIGADSDGPFNRSREIYPSRWSLSQFQDIGCCVA